ncbi:MFS transporter [Pontibacillus sp. HN14]|uniref:MFS transporter n=2 Tax=Bacillaceae TaxID=186817 RepID=A0ABY8V1K7_9BACI|nr:MULTISPECIES: MFS transporter [Pontibacillus]MCD5322395.1 MFS transporter [Pontibacillus sp. HN14]WIF99682.1 MFS transporter [Pontibacillus chungwhensis]
MTQKKSPIWTKSFLFISLSNFFLFLTFYALLTTLPIYVTDDLNGSESQAGLIVTLFLLSAILVRPFSGKLLEDFGKKRMLLISLLLFMLTTFVYVAATSFYLLLALRFFHGIWFAIATTAAGAIAADITPDSRRGEGLGYFAMSMNLAVVAGPFLALTLLNWLSFSTLFIILGALLAGALLFTSLVSAPATEAPSSKKKLSFHDLFEVKALPIALVGSLLAFSYSSVISYISIYTKSLGLLEAASFFFAVFAIAMLVSRPFVGRLFDSRGPSIVIYPSLVLFALGLLTLSITDSSFMLLLSATFIGLGYGSLVPCFQTLAIQSADHHRSGHATATFFTLFDTGIATGSYVLGIVVSLLGYHSLYFIMGLFVFVVMYLYKVMTNKKATRLRSQSTVHSS